LIEEKNQLLEYVESSLVEQEKASAYMENLKIENDKMKEKIAKNNEKQPSDDEKLGNGRENFDTFGGESDDAISKYKLQKAEEKINKLQKELINITETRNIENKSKDTDIANLTQKLELAENREGNDRLIQEMKTNFHKEIDDISKSLSLCQK